MYFFISFLLLFVLCGVLFFHRRKRKICKKICTMTEKEKCEKLTEVISPFGYCYEPCRDIFSSTLDAWQRKFGYTEAYNYFTPKFNMVFDYEPVYFDYKDRTWLIEFWKGQYGINTGAEVGLYYSNSYVTPALQDITHFESVKDKDMLPMTLHLFKNNKTLAKLTKNHWWLTIFDVGNYSEPKDLSAHIGIQFPNTEMMNSFLTALLKKGYEKEKLLVKGTKVLLLFDTCSTSSDSRYRRFLCKYAQWKNRHFCRLYTWVTKPFTTSLDRCLFLYYYLPFIFRRTLNIKHYTTKKEKK